MRKKSQYTIENYQKEKSRYCNKSSDRKAMDINIPLSDLNDHKTTYFKWKTFFVLTYGI